MNLTPFWSCYLNIVCHPLKSVGKETKDRATSSAILLHKHNLLIQVGLSPLFPNQQIDGSTPAATALTRWKVLVLTFPTIIVHQLL
jgi:hypothetical protein